MLNGSYAQSVESFVEELGWRANELGEDGETEITKNKKSKKV